MKPQILLFLLTSALFGQTFTVFEAPGVRDPIVLRTVDDVIYLAGTYRPGDDSDVSRIWVRKLSPDGRTRLFTKELDGNSWDSVVAARVDSDGFLYLLGSTHSTDFPTTADALERTKPNDTRPATLLLKLTPDGELVSSTYLFTASRFEGRSLALTANGDIVLSGVADRHTFPAPPGGYRFNGGDEDRAWTTVRLSANFREVRWAAVGVGGSEMELDAEENVYVLGASGFTIRASYPTTDGAFQTQPEFAFCGSVNLFPCDRQHVSKISADGSNLLYSTFVTGKGNDAPGGLVVNAAGQAYLLGTTNSQDYPTTEGAFQRENLSRVTWFRYKDLRSGYATLLNADGTDVVYSTYFGGIGTTIVHDAALGNDGPLFVAGMTTSFDFPAAPDWVDRCLPLDDDFTITRSGSIPWRYRREQSFVLELDDTGSAVLRSELIVGRRNQAASLVVDGEGRMLLAGTTELHDVPLTAGYEHAEPTPADFTTYLAGFDFAEPRPATTLGCLTETADYSYVREVSPMRVITLFGTGFGLPQPVSPDPTHGLPTNIEGVEVLFDGIPAPLLFAQDHQVNLVAPRAIASQETTVVELRVQGETVARQQLPVRDRTPHAFIDRDHPANSGVSEGCGSSSGLPAGRFLMQDWRLNGCGAFANPGALIALFLNGVGLAPGSLPDGTVPSEAAPLGLPVEVTVNGVPAAVEYAGTAPGQVAGIWQVNFRVPTSFDEPIGGVRGFSRVRGVVRVDGVEAQSEPMTLLVQ